MIRDSELHDRFVEAADACRADVTVALGALAGTIRARRRRHVVTIAVGAAAVIAVVAAGWSTLGATTQRLQPSQPTVRIIPPPDGVVAQQTVVGLEAKVLEQIAIDATRTGAVLAVPRIISVAYLPSGVPESSRRSSQLPNGPTWAVEFQGTYLDCIGSCPASAGGVVFFDDTTGDKVDAIPNGAVCEAYQLEQHNSLRPGSGPPSILPPCLPTTLVSQP